MSDSLKEDKSAPSTQPQPAVPNLAAVSGGPKPYLNLQLDATAAKGAMQLSSVALGPQSGV